MMRCTMRMVLRVVLTAASPRAPELREAQGFRFQMSQGFRFNLSRTIQIVQAPATPWTCKEIDETLLEESMREFHRTV